MVWGQSDNTAKKKVAVYVTGGNDINVNKVVGSKLVQAIIHNGKYAARNAVKSKKSVRIFGLNLIDNEIEAL